MTPEDISQLRRRYVVLNNHRDSDYFELIQQVAKTRLTLPPNSAELPTLNQVIAETYTLVEDEIKTNTAPPLKPLSFGTSGWRGIIGKDFTLHSVAQVTEAIVEMYRALDRDSALADDLGVTCFEEVKRRGAVLGYDNRFGGSLMAERVAAVLSGNGIPVHFAGEATTGTLSAAVLILNAAFSINLTPSHNPLNYAGFKFNAADAGPAAVTITEKITENARRIMAAPPLPCPAANPELIRECDALGCWQELVIRGLPQHGLDYPAIIERFHAADNCVVAVDCVHGASRVHMRRFFGDTPSPHLILLRDDPDPTFGGVAPEPSSENMRGVIAALQARPEPLKLGVIIDPDADRIRFTDGEVEIDMNLFGAIAYHALHEIKGKRGLVAKSVATSNFVNAIAESFGEEVFESKVGFKEFKPVIGRALACFEESDGITLIGHTPEKDAYIGLLLAIDLMLSQQKGLGAILEELAGQFGRYYPARGGVTVSRQGEELLSTLAGLDRYRPGTSVMVGGEAKEIIQVISIDGRKMIFADRSWLMIRPSGTEPKVRFYVEARDEAGKEALFAAAREMLREIGLL